MRATPAILSLLLGCPPDADPGPGQLVEDTGPTEVPWSRALPMATDTWPALRGLQIQRSIVHLHSAWSHDACDGEPLVDGVPDASCVADLRQALCDVHVDAAFLTDHPAHAADQPYEDLFHQAEGDTWLTDDDGAIVANAITCDDGHVVRWHAGIEDDLMPVGLRAHAGESADEAHAIYDSATVENVSAIAEVGGTVLMAHTEQRDTEHLAELIAGGMTGFEIFNLHAAFDPDIRADHLGLDPISWLAEIGPMTSAEGTAEPDLFVLAVLVEQSVSLQRWDEVLADHAVVGVAGTDAHQNVLPVTLRDGERGDSYRRMLRWFSNLLLVEGDHADAPQEALAAGRLWVAFEILGTPVGMDFWLEGADGETHEVGSSPTTDALPGTLHVGCPELAPSSPRLGPPPELTITVFRNGQEWATGCGQHTVEEHGIYRVSVDMLPHHLAGFLGEDPDAWLRRYPWLLSNPIALRSSG